MSAFRSVSLFKNQQATPTKKEHWQAELPIGASDHSQGLAYSNTHVYAKSSSAGNLIVLPIDAPGKKWGLQPPTINLGSAISDFAIAPWTDEVLAVAREDAKVSISSLADPTASESYAAPQAVQILRFHPHAEGLLLATSPQQITLLNRAAEVRSWKAGAKQFWDACWTNDGKSIVSASKDGVIALWDARSDGDASLKTQNHLGVKAIKLACVGDLIFSTGFSRTRDREYSIYDQRNFSKVLRTQRVDTNTGTLHPLVDHSRGIVYLAGKGDMQLRWTEITPSQTFSESSAPLPTPILGAALAPGSCLDMMKTEINRVGISSKEGVLFHVGINVPRRQYLDFHADLYPDVFGLEPGCTAQDWLDGSDEQTEKVEVTESGPNVSTKNKKTKREPVLEEDVQKMNIQEPEQQQQPRKQSSIGKAEVTAETSIASSSPAPTQQSAQHGNTPEPTQTATTLSSSFVSASSQKTSLPQAEASQLNSPAAAQPETIKAQPRTAQAPVSAKAETTKQASSSSKPKSASAVSKPTAHWSRNFLIGKTPLKSDYEGLSGLATVTAPEMLLLKANPSIFVFPLAGAGGRLAVHPISKKGRFPTRLPALVTGAAITAFELDPFRHEKVFIACDDSKIRVFDVPADLQEDHSEPSALLSDSKMDRVTELVAHPTADSLLLSVSEDRGNPTCRIWDTKTQKVILSLPIDCTGIFTARWTPDGSRLAIACKNKKLLILDPRNPSHILSAPLHDSPRLVRLTWLDSTHILTTGFSRSATRECMLYSIEGDDVKMTSKQMLDVSPAPLFPFFDIDTSILYLYAKGERTCLCFELKLHETKDQFAKLPSFEHNSLQLGLAFLPKRCVDTSKVEISVAYRLTAATVERIAFSIPRARTEFFQDDIFPPTVDVESAAMSADAWLACREETQTMLDLNNPKLPLLSEAPATAAQASTRAKIAAGPQLTDSQKSQQYMERLYAKAQADAEESEDEEKPSQVPEDDDW